MSPKKEFDKKSVFQKATPNINKNQPDYTKEGTQEATVTKAVSPPISAAQTLAFAKQDDTIPHPLNLVEIIVERLYPTYLKRINGCACERCRDDVFGIALNKTQPHYVVSNNYDTAELEDVQLITEVTKTLIDSLAIVKNSPHHDDSQTLRLQ